jgi:protein TonB
MAMGLSLLLHGFVLGAAMATTIGHGLPDETAVPITLSMVEEPVDAQPEPKPQLPHPESVPQPPATRPAPRPIKPPTIRHADVPSPAPSPEKDKTADAVSGAAPLSTPSSASGPGEASAASDEPAAFQPAAYHLGQAETPIPSYPMSARRKGHEGTVVVRLVVAEDGSPESVAVIGSSGDTALDEAAVETLKRWRLKPARRHGLPTESSIDVPIRFILN